MPTETLPIPVIKPEQQPDTRLQPRWNVVLLNDDDHSYEYVIEMLMELFSHTAEQAFLFAQEVDKGGRAIVDTTSRERGELKVEQIHAYGKDWRIARCQGSMSAELEAAP